MYFRSNAAHYWSWINSISRLPLFSVRGVVAGDAHILNFGDIRFKNGKAEIGLLDVDDAGVNAPIIADFLRYFIGNQISAFKVDAKALLESYNDGISGKKHKKPDFLDELLTDSESKFNQKFKAYIDKLTRENKFSFNADLLSLKQAPLNILKIYNQAEPFFESELKNYKILDIGYKTKTNGGSQGLPRFWFLVKKNTEMKVLEFKMAGIPSIFPVAIQPANNIRLKEIAKVYRPDGEIKGPFRYVETDAGSFLLRERFPKLIDLNPSNTTDPEEIEKGKLLSLYLANKLGQWHGQQKYTQDIFRYLSQKSTLKELMHLADQYINLLDANSLKNDQL